MGLNVSFLAKFRNLYSFLLIDNLLLYLYMEHVWDNYHKIHYWEENHSGGPWHRKEAVGEGGPADPDDTLRGVLQPRWRTGSPWLLDYHGEEAGRRSNPHRPLTSNDVYLSSAWL